MGLFSIANSVKAGGLAGLCALALVVLAQRLGVVISPEEAATIVGLAGALITHLVPDSSKQQIDALAKRLNMTVQALAAKVPEIQAVYPSDLKASTTVTNIGKA